MPSMSDITLIAYVASPHDGYLKLFRKYAGSELCIMGESLITEFPQLTRHLPGNAPADAARMVEALGIFKSVLIIERDDLGQFAGKKVVMPDEDVSRELAERYLTDSKITFDGTWKLRWDLKDSTFHKVPEGEIRVSDSELDRAFMNVASEASVQSPDWWRQVGAVLARDGEMLLVAYNMHLPSDQMAYVCGDPRSNFNAGEHIDATLSLHAEASLIAEAARRGMSTAGCDMYVTTFPCAPCAGAIGAAGIKRLFYRDGYSLVAGAASLRSRGVELYRVIKK